MSHDPPIRQTRALFGETPESLSAHMAEMGQPGYRAGQILQWVYGRGAGDFEQMTDLPAALRTQLPQCMHVLESQQVREAVSADGTRKLLLRWRDGATSECVMIPDGQRRTACISTQVGCPVGCVFCASGLDGLERQLTAAQIVEQAVRLAPLSGPERLTNVVFMGLGEPLHNYHATVAAIRILNASWGMNIGARKITVSTVGLPRQMKQLAEERLQTTLALSLHAPNDELRRRIIPWAHSVSIEALIEAANTYFDRTGREVTLEYVLLGGLNDQPRHAHQLARVAQRMRSHVNLIRYNPVQGLPYQRPDAQATERFQQILRQHGVNTHTRRSRGQDIDGACGQLRRHALPSRR